MSRERLLTDVASAVEAVGDGDTVAIGGFLTSHKPMAVVRDLVREGRSGLTVVAPPTSLETDLLVAAGCVDTVIAPYVGAEHIAPIAPWFRRRVEAGAVEVGETDGGMVVAALEAAERNLPFMPWRGGVGTSIPDLNDVVEVFEDPLEGEQLIAVPAIEPDVALLHTARSDPFGNVQAMGDTFADGLIARAARRTFVQVEEVVAPEAVRQRPERTLAGPGNVDGVIEARWGAHPFSCQGHYLADEPFLAEYVEAAGAALDGDDADWEAFLDTYVRGPASQAEYVETVGVDRLAGLTEYGGETA